MFGHLWSHSAILGAQSCHLTTIFGVRAQKEDTTHRERWQFTSVPYYLNLLRLFVLNGMNGVLEGHNIAQTSPRWTSKCLVYHYLCVLAGDLNNAYARAQVLSMEQAVTSGGG